MAETGHAKNVEHFQQMISFCEGYGAAYAPTNAAIIIVEFENKLADSQAGIDGVTTDLIPWKVAVNERQDAFEGIRKLTTRAINAFAASGVPDSAVDDARTFKRKIDGARAEALQADDPETPDDESKGNSVSQQSYTQLVEHLDNFIGVLSNYPAYNPNENDLKVATLTTLSNTLKTKNTNVMQKIAPLSNARIARDEALYADDTGLVDLAGLVKKYVKSVFGADSPQYQQISGLQFTRPR